MNRFLAFALIPVIVVLPGCGALALQSQNEKLGQVIETLNEIRQVEASARKQADVDGDGKLSVTEMVAYGGLVAAGLTELARRKQGATLASKHEASAEDRNELWAKLEALDAKNQHRA